MALHMSCWFDWYLPFFLTYNETKERVVRSLVKLIENLFRSKYKTLPAALICYVVATLQRLTNTPGLISREAVKDIIGFVGVW